MTESKISQSFGTLFTVDDGVQHRASTLAKRVAGNTCQLDIGIFEHFLNPACNPRVLLRQAGPCSSEITQVTNHHWRYISAAQESVLQEFCDPLTILRICLASRNCLDVLSVRQHDLKVALENIPHWLPIDTCGLHGHVLNAKLAQPSDQLTKFARAASEVANML